MPSKITPIKRSEEIRPAFTCPHCGSHSCSPISAEGRVAGKHEKRHVCLGCGRIVEKG